MNPLRGLVDIFSMRSAHQRVNSAVMVALAAFIIVLVNLIARQFYFRLDASATGRYSLSARGEAAARALADDAALYYFGSENSPEFGRMRDLLESCRYANRKVACEIHDLDRAPALAGELGVSQYNTLVAVSGGRRYHAVGASEDMVTTLLVRAARRKTPSIAFLAGHGERRPDGKERADFGAAADRLGRIGYDVRPLDISVSGGVPAGVELVVIAGQSSPLFAPEMAAIEKYVSSGGRLLVLAENAAFSRPVLSLYGVQISDKAVSDAMFAPGAGPSSPMITSYPGNPVSAGVVSGAIFPGVHALAGSPGDDSFRPVVATSDQSWLDMDGNSARDNGEKAMSYNIAAAVFGKNGKPKAVVFGDADFASNAYVVNEANAGLFLNSVEWLAAGEAVSSAAPSSDASKAFIPMFVTDDQARMVRSFGAIGIPALIASAGLAVWFRRRRL